MPLSDLPDNSLNIAHAPGQFLCPVCGYPVFGPEPVYSESGEGIIGRGICPCCLWEPGFDDEPLASARAQPTVLASINFYRNRWMTLAQWQGQVAIRPANYDGRAQLSALRDIAPWLFAD